MSRPIRVAITCVGGGIGQSIVQGCRLSRLPLELVGFDANPLAFGAYDCDAQDQVLPISDPHYVEHLFERCRAHRIDLLIPGLDSELPWIADSAEFFRRSGIAVLVGGASFIALCRDKVRWSRELRPVCQAIIPSWERNDLARALTERVARFPLIAKPKDGSASTGVQVLRSEADLALLGEAHVIQPFVFPDKQDPNYESLRSAVEEGRLAQISEVSFQLVVAKDGTILGMMATANRLKGGVPVEIVPVDPTPFWDALAPLVPHLRKRGMRGPVNFQGRMTEDGPRFFEMNGRFTGITGLRAMLGFNEVDALIREELDLKRPNCRRSLTPNPHKIGLRQVQDRAVPAAHNPMLASVVTRTGGWCGRDRRRVVLVTGGTGWLGRHLIRALVEHPDVEEVIAVVRDPQRARAVFADIGNHPLTVLRCEPWEAEAWNLGSVDLVYHLASGRAPDGPASIATGLQFTERLINEAQRVHLPAFVNLSSQSVYGTAELTPWVETLQAAPETPYAMAKWASELMVARMRERHPACGTTSIRLARLYGLADGMRWSELPHLFARRAAVGDPILIQGGGQRFDLLHIRDAVAALCCLLERPPQTWAPVYNLGAGAACGILEIAEAAVAAAQAHGVAEACYRLQPDGGSMSFGMDIGRFQSDFAWMPCVTLQEAIRELVDYISWSDRRERSAATW